ncbi:glycosyltransferase [bacterium]|nr:glycosyltransferase [bacterium]
MKMLFFFNGDFGEGNAANARFLCYGKGLNQQAIDNHFYVIRPSEFGDSGINTHSKGQVQGVNVNFTYLGGETIRRKSIGGRIFMLLKAWAKAFAILRQESPGQTKLYFYGPQLITHLPILLSARFFGFHTTYELTELHSIKQESAAWKTRLASLSHFFIQESIPVFCDRLLVTTRRLQLFYKRKFPYQHVAIMLVVFDSDRFSYQTMAEPVFRLGYLGSFGEKDGVAGIVEAFAKCRQHLPELKLRLIGYQTAGFDLAKVLAQNGLSSHDPFVEITGQVSTAEIPTLLSACDLLLMNRINSKFANLGYPIKLGEYMATGRAVLATKVSDIAQHFTHRENAYLIEPENIDQLIENIIWHYNNFQKGTQIGIQGRTRATELFEYRNKIGVVSGQ